MITVYSKEHCMYCVKAKALLEQKGIPFEEIRVDQNEEAKEFLKAQGHRTVPQIYKEGKLFVEGGFTGLQAYLNEAIFG